jgi:pyruvate formate lyase activating enzyme
MSSFITGLRKFSLIDYPGKISCILFTHGCNFRCPYCHNPELVSGKKGDTISQSAILEFLNSRRGKLDGVVITGGEPTLHKGLIGLIKSIKDMDFLVKLDTNGTNYKMLEVLIENELIDYVAMDVKAPIRKYEKVVKRDLNTEVIKESIELIMNSEIEYEFRTTVVKRLLSEEDLKQIVKELKGAKQWVLQKFVKSKTLDPEFIEAQTYSDKEFEGLKRFSKDYVDNVIIR